MKNTRIVFERPYDVRYETLPLDETLAEDEVLIRTIYSLISPGTELALYTGTHIGIEDPDNTFAKYPFYPGYAIVGEIVSAGSEAGPFVPGDVVYTLGRHAAYNKVSVLNQRNHPLLALDLNAGPEPLLKEAVFTRLAAIAATSIVLSDLRIGDTVVVIGMGLIGNLAAQLYALHGAEVIAVDVVEERLQIARESGIQKTILSGPAADFRAALQELTGKTEADIVIEATGSPQLVIPALEWVKHLGQVVALGSTRGRVDLNVYKHIHCKGVRFIGAQENLQDQIDFPSSRFELSRYALRLIQQKQLNVEPLITQILAYSEAHHGYEKLLHRQQLGVLLDWRTSAKGD